MTQQLLDCDAPREATSNPQRDIRAPSQQGRIPVLLESRDHLGVFRYAHLTRPARCISGYGAATVAAGPLEDSEVGVTVASY